MGHVAIAVTSTSNEPNCLDSWYSVSPSSPGVYLNQSIPTGTSYYTPSGASISMPAVNTNQDACQGRTVNLGFTASGS